MRGAARIQVVSGRHKRLEMGQACTSSERSVLADTVLTQKRMPIQAIRLSSVSYLFEEVYGAPREIRTPDLLIRSRRNAVFLHLPLCT